MGYNLTEPSWTSQSNLIIPSNWIMLHRSKWVLFLVLSANRSIGVLRCAVLCHQKFFFRQSSSFAHKGQLILQCSVLHYKSHIHQSILLKVNTITMHNKPLKGVISHKIIFILSASTLKVASTLEAPSTTILPALCCFWPWCVLLRILGRNINVYHPKMTGKRTWKWLGSSYCVWWCWHAAWHFTESNSQRKRGNFSESRVFHNSGSVNDSFFRIDKRVQLFSIKKRLV